MPMNLFEGVVNQRSNEEIHRISDVRQWHPRGYKPGDVTAHPVRTSIALFLAEVLAVVTREGDADERLWNLIVDTVNVLSRGNAQMLANLPLSFLLRLADTLGIAPDFSEAGINKGFDMVEGVFKHSKPLHDYWLDSNHARVLKFYAEISERYAHLGLLRVPRRVRTQALERFIDYFVLHHYPLDRMKSLDIIKAVFSV